MNLFNSTIMTRITLFFLTICLTSLCFTACEKDDSDRSMVVPGPPISDFEFSTGLDPNGDLTTTPVNPNFGFGIANIPSSVDLTQHFPPIGNQGNFGTCVAWAVGYNMKTAINAIKDGATGSTLADPSRQGSPRYLFTSVPDNQKSANCGGMLFEPALEVLRTKGLASQATVPYTQLGDCKQQLADPSWDTDAANNKIESYRRIDGTVTAIKQSLADKQPIVFGAKLGRAFGEWRGDGVLNTLGQFDPNFQHAYHAMVFIGYDDTKGANGAFRVANSWDVNWGDVGYIWIDYNFFINEMMMKDQSGNAFLYTATTAKGSSPDDNTPTPPSGGGVELVTWMYDDTYDPDSQSDLDRIAEYDIYNFGTSSAQAASNWDVYYIYYNAYDINDWGVLFSNEFTTSVSDVECGDTGCRINADISAQSSLGIELFQEEIVTQGYSIPSLNGEYFLMMVADAEEEIIEGDEVDNYFFPSLDPIFFNNGIPALKEGGTGSSLRRNGAVISQNEVSKADLASGRIHPEATQGNSYTLSEMKQFVNVHKASGELDRRASKAISTSVSTKLISAKQ